MHPCRNSLRLVLMRRALWLIDLVCVLVFVAIGRSAHAHGSSFGGLASTAWPFVTGLAAGWCWLGIRRSPGGTVSSGVVITASTVVVGMALRVVAGQGTAFAFVLVAFGFLGATMIGWRLLGIALGRARAADRVT